MDHYGAGLSRSLFPASLKYVDRIDHPINRFSLSAQITVCSPDLSVGDFLESDAGVLWVEVAGVRVYSCYFSPNDPFEVFETQILLLEKSLSEAVGRSLIGGDFNSKSPEWGETRLDRRQ